MHPPNRRSARAVEWAALEMRCTGDCTGGSNPSFSAIEKQNPLQVRDLQGGFCLRHHSPPTHVPTPPEQTNPSLPACPARRPGRFCGWAYFALVFIPFADGSGDVDRCRVVWGLFVNGEVIGTVLSCSPHLAKWSKNKIIPQQCKFPGQARFGTRKPASEITAPPKRKVHPFFLGVYLCLFVEIPDHPPRNFHIDLFV